MGDRANIIILQDKGEPPVVLYMHNGGYMLRERLEKAMFAAATRTGDPHYYTRLLVKALNDIISGIGTSIDDNEHLIPVVDSLENEIVEWIDEKQARGSLSYYTTTKKTFNESL